MFDFKQLMLTDGMRRMRSKPKQFHLAINLTIGAFLYCFAADEPAAANILITDSGNHRIIEIDKTDSIVWQFGIAGESGSDAKHLNFPSKAVRLKDRRTLIVDTENRRILILDSRDNVQRIVSPHASEDVYPLDAVLDGDRLWIADGQGRLLCERNGRWLRIIDSIKNASGDDARVGTPTAVSVIGPGVKAVVDSERSRVVGIDDRGYRLWQYGINDIAWGDGPALNHPRSIHKLGDAYYISDTGNSRIVNWKPGQVQAEVILGGSRGCAEGQLNEPVSAEPVDDGLLVCEKFNHRVTIYGRDSSIVWRYGDNYKPGDEPGCLREPTFAQYVRDGASRQGHVAKSGELRPQRRLFKTAWPLIAVACVSFMGLVIKKGCSENEL